jgi:hypothetical protein
MVFKGDNYLYWNGSAVAKDASSEIISPVRRGHTSSESRLSADSFGPHLEGQEGLNKVPSFP